jgi:hypothetical protein
MTRSRSSRPLRRADPEGTRSVRIDVVSWLYIALLALAVAVLIGAEWPRLESRLGIDPHGRQRRARSRRKGNLRVVRDEADDFAKSVERDLANLPTIDESERR